MIETGSPKGIYQISTETSFTQDEPSLSVILSSTSIPFYCLFVNCLLISLGYSSNAREEIQWWGLAQLGSVLVKIIWTLRSKGYK